jgi:hypothetical protein
MLRFAAPAHGCVISLRWALVPIPHEPASDIDTAAVDSLKVLDPNRPIKEATE